MVLNYKTCKLPLQFIFLGTMLFGLGIWRMIVFDWKGILFFLISVIILFSKSGIVIDAKNQRIKKYIGIFTFKSGEWESIESVLDLQIIKTKETQNMNVVSITRIETTEVYKLFFTLPDGLIEVMSGSKDIIHSRAESISSLLQVSIKN